MKISVFPTFLSLILTMALSYWIYYIAREDENVLLLTIGTVISFLSTLAFSMAVKYSNEKLGINVIVWNIIAFVVMLITNLCFAWLGVNVPYYIILMVILLVVHLFIVGKFLEIKDI